MLNLDRTLFGWCPVNSCGQVRQHFLCTFWWHMKKWTDLSFHMRTFFCLFFCKNVFTYLLMICCIYWLNLVFRIVKWFAILERVRTFLWIYVIMNCIRSCSTTIVVLEFSNFTKLTNIYWNLNLWFTFSL